MPTIAELADDVLTRLSNIEGKSADIPTLRNQIVTLRGQVDALHQKLDATTAELTALKNAVTARMSAPHLMLTAISESERSSPPSEPGWSDYDVVYVVNCIATLSNGTVLPNDQVSYELAIVNGRWADVKYVVCPGGNYLTQIPIA